MLCYNENENEKDTEKDTEKGQKEPKPRESRLRGKGKGKEVLVRFAGETVPSEPAPVVRDPRRAPGFRRPPVARPARAELYEVMKYEVSAPSDTRVDGY